MDFNNQFYDPLAFDFGGQQTYQTVQNFNMSSTQQVQPTFGLDSQLDRLMEQSFNTATFQGQMPLASENFGFESQHLDLIGPSFSTPIFQGQMPLTSETIGLNNQQPGLLDQSFSTANFQAQVPLASENFGFENQHLDLMGPSFSTPIFHEQAPLVPLFHLTDTLSAQGVEFLVDLACDNGVVSGQVPPVTPNLVLNFGGQTYNGQVDQTFDHSIFSVTEQLNSAGQVFNHVISGQAVQATQPLLTANQQLNPTGQGFNHVVVGHTPSMGRRPLHKNLQPRGWNTIWMSQRLSSGGNGITTDDMRPVGPLHNHMDKVFAPIPADFQITAERERLNLDRNKLAVAMATMKSLQGTSSTAAEHSERLHIEGALVREELFLKKKEKSLTVKERRAEKKLAATNKAAQQLATPLAATSTTAQQPAGPLAATNTAAQQLATPSAATNTTAQQPAGPLAAADTEFQEAEPTSTDAEVEATLRQLESTFAEAEVEAALQELESTLTEADVEAAFQEVELTFTEVDVETAVQEPQPATSLAPPTKRSASSSPSPAGPPPAKRVRTAEAVNPAIPRKRFAPMAFPKTSLIQPTKPKQQILPAVPQTVATGTETYKLEDSDSGVDLNSTHSSSISPTPSFGFPTSPSISPASSSTSLASSPIPPASSSPLPDLSSTYDFGDLFTDDEGEEDEMT